MSFVRINYLIQHLENIHNQDLIVPLQEFLILLKDGYPIMLEGNVFINMNDKNKEDFQFRLDDLIHMIYRFYIEFTIGRKDDLKIISLGKIIEEYKKLIDYHLQSSNFSNIKYSHHEITFLHEMLIYCIDIFLKNVDKYISPY